MEILKSEKILIIQTAFPGDAILTLPLTKFLKTKGYFVSVLCIPATENIFSNSPCVDETIVYDKRHRNKGFKGLISIISKIRAKKFVKIYSPHRSFRSTLIAYLSGTKLTYSFDKSSFSFLYSKKVKYDINRHEVFRNLELAGFSNEISLSELKPEIRFSDLKNELALIFKDNFQKTIVIAPGSVWNTKIYPAEYFREICKIMLEKKYRIILVGSGDDLSVCNFISESSDEILNLAGKLSIIESISLISKCDLVIANDSAPTHMAQCTDTPVLTIYCSTVPEFGFYPVWNNSKFIGVNNLACKPCGIHGYKECPKKHFKCGWDLKPDSVIEKIEEILK